ncbi:MULTISPECIES: hypothetical protein [unclassified Micromonospora]|uniref:hypothetical protein n=1 Tax=unclassified Micromonospora TaxID=2617518 RepID=UPI00249BDF8F|nr:MULTISPECIES: hypothetical protein [unclassified Micromonospora]WFE54099.1 hypothetical protein O7617_28835 [Micromonospora sp. WMMD1155]WFE99376.1 hypothetical protein O7616_21055 [Micromonospora sp. WMMD964]
MRRVDVADGAIAGAVGSTALNVVSYLDMALRGRPESDVPQETVDKLAGIAHVDLGSGDRRANRRSGLGPLIGYGLGIAAGVAFALYAGDRRQPLPVATGLLGAGVMTMTDGSITALGISDPRTWRRSDWISDIIPHLAYGLTAAATWNRLRRPSGRGR